MATRKITARRWLLMVVALTAGGAISWCAWPRNQVQITRAGQTATAEASADREINVTIFAVSAAVEELCWDHDSANLAILTKNDRSKGNEDRTLLAFHLAGERQEVLHKTDAVLLGLAYWPDGTSVGSASWRTGPKGECEILLWDTATRKRAGRLIGAPLNGMGVPFTSDPLTIAVSTDGKFLAAGTKLVDAGMLHGAHIGGEVCVWELATKSLKWFDRTTHTDIVQSVAFSNDGKVLASAGIDKLIRIWDTESGKLKATLSGAAWHGINSVAFSPDGRMLASGGSGEEDGGSVRVWDVTTGLMQHRFSAFRPRSNVRVAFTPDGRSLIAVGPKKDSNQTEFAVHAWNPSTGQHQARLASHAGSPRSMAISHNGERVAVGTFEGHIALIDLPK